MNIIVVGCGKVGQTIAHDLIKEGHDLVLIEQNQKILEHHLGKMDVRAITGNGALSSIQEEASVADCDMFIAVSPQDETNIIAAITAKTLGAPMTIARVRDPHYTKQMGFIRRELGINSIINPELEAAKNAFNMISFPEAENVERFAQGQVYMLELCVCENSQAIGKNLQQIRASFPSLLCTIILRDNGDVIIPKGYHTLEKDDHLYVVGHPKELQKFYQFVGQKQKHIRKILIIGGGKITEHLLPLLTPLDLSIKVIEKNEEKAELLAERYPQAEIIWGDGSNKDFLHEQRFKDYDACLTLTGVDEENLMTTLFAQKEGIPKNITKLNSRDLIGLISEDFPASILTPKKIISDQIVRTVRAIANAKGSKVLSLYRLVEDKVEAVLFKVGKSSRCLKTPLRHLKLKNHVLLAYIVRQSHLIFPTGLDELKENDQVLIFTTEKGFDDIDDILRD